MRDTDPLRLRVAGAIDFVEHLAQTPGLDWQAAVYSYSSNWQMRAPFLSDLTRLRQGIEQIGASGGTNTYYALRKTLFEFASGPRSAPSLRKAIVLFSDGQPNDAHRRDEVCQEAVRLGVPIFAIGLGPASDLSPDADPAAVEEMRAIANCTGAAYAGIAPNDPTAIQRIYVSIATAAAQGSLTYDVTLSGPGFEALQPGQRVEGRLQLSSGGASASASFQFTVPPATAAHFTSHPVSSVGE